MTVKSEYGFEVAMFFHKTCPAAYNVKNILIVGKTKK